ncbi:PREDICTED: dehydrogenase/reductase SDR family member 11-like [Wasmannia auropunctata]|uniref:dehydrogenase/reductase SDR family member 11-like n=1 Tax=Wasmannia auropunctata TaxID=64793 RepID=UPI0005EDFE82|nr:PREDICTED: dehydrogenase/reductase SDR family member 11-like [Wasmannia auropunctata]XP_011697948.1 PREDICTED: dehydrogenase/reductase SDR family member 11-like [Wasmannia auropunctata]
MIRWRSKIAVVTGAGSGIGEAITRALLQNGVNVVALDIQKERLAKLDAECKQEGSRTFGSLHTICCDVNCENDIDAAFLHIETLGGVDIMVNNAGIIDTSRIIDSDRKTFERMLDTNVLAVAVCTNKAVHSMRKRNGEGHIFSITSVLSHSLVPASVGGNLYAASKHASLALTHTVRRELAEIKAPIRVTSISPGTVKTNILEHSNTMRNFFEKAQLILQPSDIANAVIYALGTRPEVQITQLIIQPTGESIY